MFCVFGSEILPERFRKRDWDDNLGFCFKFPPFHVFWKDFLKYRHPGIRIYEDKALTAPKVFLDEDDSGYTISLEIPGISRDEIELDASTEEIWFRAESEEMKRGYQTHLYFRKPVKVEAIKASLKAGILTIQAPFLNKKPKKRVDIE